VQAPKRTVNCILRKTYNFLLRIARLTIVNPSFVRYTNVPIAILRRFIFASKEVIKGTSYDIVSYYFFELKQRAPVTPADRKCTWR
jgi:hypothetical protein